MTLGLIIYKIIMQVRGTVTSGQIEHTQTAAEFLVADTQLYKRLCWSVGPLVHWSVEGIELMLQLVSCEFVSVWEGVGDGVGLRLGVGCPCPPVRNDIVTPRHLFSVCEYNLDQNSKKRHNFSNF